MCHLLPAAPPSNLPGRGLIVAALGALGLALMALLILLPDRLVFAASVDVGVTQTGSTAFPVVGAPLTYTVVITNGATQTDGPVLFTDTLPANVSLADVTTTQGDCNAGNPVTCTLGPTLDANAIVTVTIAVTPTAAGPADNQVAITVTALDTDTFADNDTSTLPLTIGPGASTITITDNNPNPSFVGQSVTVSFTVAGPGVTPTGSVTVTVNGGPETCTGTLAAGSGSCSLTLNSASTHTLTANYGGDANYLTSSVNVTHTVIPANTTTTLATSGSPSVFGQSVTFTATVTAQAPGSGTPTGTVTFFVDGSPVVTPTLNAAGQATFITSTLPVGPHNLTATYNGSANYNASSSLTLTQQVNPANTTTTLATSGSPSVFGQSVTFTATVTAQAPGSGTPTGTVTFFVDGSPVVTPTLNAAGQATFITSTLPVGPHNLTATYNGSANYNASSSLTLTQQVNPANTTTTLATSGSPSVFGQSVTFTATVTAQVPGSGTPSGTVTFYDGGNVLGSNTLNGAGVASISTAGLSLGTHTITATYGGSANYNASSSLTLTQQVNNPVPVLNSLSPLTTTAGASSPLALTLNGVNFVAGAVAQWNGADQETGVISPTRLLANILPSNLAFAGVFSMTAVNPGPGGGVSNVRIFTVTNPIPTVSGLSQNTAIAGGPAFTLTVNGSNFVTGPYPSVVLWNNTPLATTFVSASQLTATVTAANIASAGNYTVTVANPQPDGTRSLAQVQNFTVVNPSLTLTPSTLTLLTGRTDNLTVTINGVQAADRIISLSSSNAGVVAVPASVTLPANTASVTFTVTAVASGTATVTATLPSALGGGGANANVTVNNPVPSITGLNPVTTTVGGPALTLTVNGSDFVNGSVVRWAGSNLATSFVNSTRLTATVPAANLTGVGTFSITVFNPPLGGGLSNALPFTVTYPAPVLTAISPLTATAGNLTTTLILTGSNFVTASVVRWGESDLNTTFVSNTRLTAVISATLLAVPGPVEIRVFNPEPGGGRSAPQTFTVVSQTPLVRLGASSYVVGKNGGTIAIPVQQLSPIVTQTITVTVATTDGTAQAGRDYTAIHSRLVFPPGTFVQTVMVPILNNDFYTGNRQFTVLLSEPVNTLIGNPSTASVTIAETNARTGCTLHRNSTSLPIPDNNPAGVESVITLSSPNVFVDNLNVRIESLQHTYLSDLILTLIAPDGRRVTLFNRFGGGGDHLLFTVFQDGGTPFTAVPNGAPYTGAFNPASSLGVLRGTPVSGAWRLHIADNVSGDEGELQAWSLDICGFTSYRVYLPFIRR
ncbi:MAG: Ig-like domain repeat protein [Anaerolineales bacterium]|nr:Ig-like domain repeat protein [Anaerolineales bacterium]